MSHAKSRDGGQEEHVTPFKGPEAAYGMVTHRKGGWSSYREKSKEWQRIRPAREARSCVTQERGFYMKCKSHRRLLRREVKRLGFCFKQLCYWKVNELKE